MAHKDDYVPAGDAEFNTFFKNIVDYVNQKTGGNVPEWDFIPPGDLAAFNAAWDEWDAAYQKTLVPHTPVDTAAKNRVRVSSEKTLREFINRFLRYPPVTPDDRAAMGIPEKDPTRTPHVLEFTEEERGKTVYVCLQWQNEKGGAGPPQRDPKRGHTVSEVKGKSE